MINFSGLASGLDSAAIIDALVGAERSKTFPLEARKSALEGQKTVVAELVTRLKALADAGKELDTASELEALSATTSADNRLAVTAGSGAQTGSYAMRVNALAAATSTTSRTFATADAGVLGAGSVDITVGADAPINVAYTSTDTLYDVAERIRDSDARVNASVLFDGTNYRLMVTGEDTGAANAVSFTDSGDGLDLANPTNVLVAASDASFTLNGIAVTSGSNVVSDALTGVTFTLEAVHDAGEPDAVVEIARDPEGQKDKLQGYVDAYNEVIDLVNEQLTYVEGRGTDNLFGDSTVRSLQGALSGIVTSAYPTGATTTSIGQLGLELDRTGKITIDQAALDSAVTANPDALSDLFLGDGVSAGLFSRVSDTVNLYTRFDDGMLPAKTNSLTDRIASYDDSIERIENVALRMREQLERQFSALEATMSQLQLQSGFLGSLGQ